ncbi:MAG: hypothetical protein AAF989_08560 [Planctomycetota bacterium]
MMNFDDLQVIWDSQSERTMYQFDEQALLSAVERRSRSIASMVSCFEIMMALNLIALGIMLLAEPVLEQKEFYQLPQAAMALGAAIYIWRSRQTRIRTEAQFDESLLGKLDRSIYQLGYKIGLSKGFPWWFTMPMLIGVTVTLPFVYDSKPIWLWPIVFGGLMGCYIPIDREIRNKLSPVKTELESLRDKLANGNENPKTST